MLWASNYDCCIFPFRYFNLLLGDWSNFWCVIFILWSSLLNKTYASFHLPECFPYFFRFLFSAKNNVFNRKQGMVLLGHSVRLKPETPSPFCSCCLLCWAMTALAERHGFSINTSQKFCLLFIVCLNTLSWTKMWLMLDQWLQILKLNFYSWFSNVFIWKI